MEECMLQEQLPWLEEERVFGGGVCVCVVVTTGRGKLEEFYFIYLC